MNRSKRSVVPIVTMRNIEDPDGGLRGQDRGAPRSLYRRRGRIVGARLAGNIEVAGVGRSLVPRRADVSRFEAQLVDRGFGMTGVILDALLPSGVDGVAA